MRYSCSVRHPIPHDGIDYYHEIQRHIICVDLDDTLIDTKSAMHQAKQRFKSLNGFSDEDMKQFNSIFHPFSSKEEVGKKFFSLLVFS